MILAKKHKQNKTAAGFTLIEVVLAIFILGLAIIASFVLIQQSIIGASLNESQLIAYYLGQEGIEIVKNIRDINWLGSGSGVSEGVWEADYLSMSLEPLTGEGRYLRVDQNGFYRYADSGSISKFKREIRIARKADNDFNEYLEVSVVVKWKNRGKDYQAEVINHLYNWYGL